MKTRRPYCMIIALLTITCSCALWPPRSAPYDPAFDAGVTSLQKDVQLFFTEVQASAGTEEGAHPAFEPDYRSFGSRIAALREQAARHARNDGTLQSLDLLRENLEKVEAMHREGLLPKEVEILHSLVDVQLRLLLQLERAKRGAVTEVS